MNRRVLAIAVAVLVALAGCSAGPLGGGSSAPDVSEQSWTDGEEVNVTAVFEAHADAAADLSSFEYESATTVASGGERAVTLALNNESERALKTTEPAGENADVRRSFFANDTVYVNAGDGESRAYTEDTNFTRFVDRGAALPAAPEILAQWDFEYEGFEDGAFVFEADSATADEDAPGIDVTNVVSTNATLVVEESGLVRSMQVSATVERDGERETLTTSAEYDSLNETTVETPDWVDEA
ncbi:DUF7537 family lipoprotein [Halobacterium litoreum]|uniref:Lipoprotein n=1 Tax=Halobacterium litoreum TaxID=2039234 RepID=A0ABD5NBU7_9EURY|nr:hypothetical protein [Halobacterium litoreum]UHH14458.1 hypothetical protein LT972_05530 [Halobacterium litoreum]